MFGNVLTFTINVNGDANNTVTQIEQSIDSLTKSVGNTSSHLSKMGEHLLKFNQFTQYIQNFSSAIDGALQPGIALNASLSDLQSITGVSGKGLKEIEQYARDSARAFGVDAAQSVEGYKLILSQLSPEIAKVPEALKGMGENIATLSKTMGGNTTAAAEVLTTAMNQFGVSTEDPIRATEIMTRMMNVMAAAAKEGSAELPQIKQALEQAGMAAKGANVSFEETNAAIQVLDKAGKKGAEGGVALRNIMAIIGKGRFLPQDTLDGLQAAGISVEELGNKNLTLSQRLSLLKPLLNDTALLSKTFGMENQNAAIALISQTQEVDRYTNAIQGTNAATEQAAVVMENYRERQARIKAVFDDMKISLFNITGDMGIWTGVLMQSLIPLAQIIPLISGVASGFKLIKSIEFTKYIGYMSNALKWARLNLVYMNNDLITGQLVHLGFIGNVVRATLAIGRFATVGIWSAIKGLGALIVSLITGGATSATFAAISSGAFATFAASARVACAAVSKAIFSIPIIGWIALAIAGIAALFIFLYKKVDTFRAVMNGIGAAIKALFKGESASEAYNNAYVKTLDETARKRSEEADKEEAERRGMSVEEYRRVKKEAEGAGVTVDEYLMKNPTARYGLSDPTIIGGTTMPTEGVPEPVQNNATAAATGGTRNTQITISFESLVENMNFNGKFSESIEQLKGEIEGALTKVIFAAQTL
jgi:TP901 family phage tail tape measure protein